MNSVTILICLSTTLVAGFSPSILPNHNAIAQRVVLNAIMFEPPVDDNCEIDGDCEESVFARKRREKAEARSATMEKYQQQGISLSEIDLMETVDQYQNAMVGGNLIPGVSLTALCEDD